jgi:hypothetical protein
MSEQKQKMQADGGASRAGAAQDETGEVASRRDPRGESGGGAYPNPHSGKDGDGIKGGGSQQAYFGKGQLGEKDVEGEPEPANAPSRQS